MNAPITTKTYNFKPLLLWTYQEEEEAQYEIYQENQTILENDLLINLPEDFVYPGYYYVYYDGGELDKFFLSASLESLNESNFTIYPISGKNNVIIKSYDYYLPFITKIVVLNTKTNEYITYDKSNITFVENDYIKITLPNNNGNEEKPIYIIETITGINSMNEISSEPEYKTINLSHELEYDTPIKFSLEKKYQIGKESLDPIVFKFEINDNTTPEQLEEIFSRIYINGELKVINYDKLEECKYESKSVSCDFINPGRYTKLEITYNEFDETIQKYTCIFYNFDGKKCMLEEIN